MTPVKVAALVGLLIALIGGLFFKIAYRNVENDLRNYRFRLLGTIFNTIAAGVAIAVFLVNWMLNHCGSPY